MILRLLNSLQSDLESFTVGDPYGINIFMAKSRATFRGIRQELARSPSHDKDELRLINNKISVIEGQLDRLEGTKVEFASRLECALRPTPAKADDENGREFATSEKPAEISPSPTAGRPKSDQPGELQIRRRQLSPLAQFGDKESPHNAEGKRQSRKLVEDISADLVHLARRLKHSNLAIQELVERDKRVVNEAGTNLTLNVGRFQTQHRELQKFSSKSWATTWRLIVLTLLIIISIWLAFMLIIVTRKNQ